MSVPWFRPHPLVRGGVLQTVVPAVVSPRLREGATTVHELRLEDGDILTILEDRAAPSASAALLLVHELGGSGRSPHVARMATALGDAGLRVFRMNHRGIADGRGRARGVYHARREDDLHAALEWISSRVDVPVVTVALSLSATVLLHWAIRVSRGELTPPDEARGIVAISPAYDIRDSAARIDRFLLGVARRRAVAHTQRYLARREQAFPDVEHPDPASIRGMIDFGERFTAPLTPFADYAQYVAASRLDDNLLDIQWPTVIIEADDDPLVPTTPAAVAHNRYIEHWRTRSGGHLGFFAAEATPSGSRFWLDWAVLEAAQRLLGRAG